MFLRHLRDVMEKTSFSRYVWDVLKTSYKRRLFWDVSKTSYRRHEKDIIFEMYLRHLKDVSKKASLLRCFWEVSERSFSMEIWLKSLRDISCRLGYYTTVVTTWRENCFYWPEGTSLKKLFSGKAFFTRQKQIILSKMWLSLSGRFY